MKKGQIYQGYVDHVDFPNKGVVIACEKVTTGENGEEIITDIESESVIVKNTIKGQKVRMQINKVRHKKAEGRLLDVVEKSLDEIESPCPHFKECGGCAYQNLPYEKQLDMKRMQVESILKGAVDHKSQKEGWFEGIKASPLIQEYRNKMEFTFGDEYKDGPLALGMHKRGSFYDIVTVDECKLVHPDFRQVLKTTLDFFKKAEIPYFHRVRHEGYLRHLLVRRAVKTEEILIDLVTTTQLSYFDKATPLYGDNKSEKTPDMLEDSDLRAVESKILTELVERLVALETDGKITGHIAGILHTKNDSLADVVIDEGTDILYGKDYFYEELLNLKFKITPFSFFQTNTLGAQVLYETAREYASEAIEDKPVIFDLYSGTGTIAQIMAPVAKKVIGVEIVEEAVEAAKENTALNGLHNCDFVAGDVLKVLDDFKNAEHPVDNPDFIILDPPRDGCHPKALPKILDYGTDSLVYISCKITSLARDLEMLQARGYMVKRAVAIDQFPNTAHVETVILMSRKEK